MAGTCEVCVSEPSKYKCPTCGLMSCSLACTQSHKIYCAPKVQAPDTTTAANIDQTPSNITTEPDANEKTQPRQDAFDVEAIASSPQIRDLLAHNPKLRDQLLDIYKTTLEEEWVDHGHAGRSRPYRRGRGGRGGHQNRGSWTWEKGFNRGLGKVRKMRERCEEGVETGKHAESFIGFRTLINGDERNKSSV